MYLDGTWVKDTPSNCKNYNFLETLIYEGVLENWSISGSGKRIYIDGSYEGKFSKIIHIFHSYFIF